MHLINHLNALDTCHAAVGNLVTQAAPKGTATECGLFDTGFAGNFYDPSLWRTVLEVKTASGQNISTASLKWPVLYAHGNVL